MSEIVKREPPRDANGNIPDWWRPPTPFEKGNTLQLKDGWQSPIVRADYAAGVRAFLAENYPWLAHPKYEPAVAQYCAAVARWHLADKAIARRERNGDPGSPRLFEAAAAAQRLSWQIGERLGLSPLGEAVLKQESAGAVTAEQSLADLMEQGRQTKAGKAFRADVHDTEDGAGGDDA